MAPEQRVHPSRPSEDGSAPGAPSGRLALADGVTGLPARTGPRAAGAAPAHAWGAGAQAHDAGAQACPDLTRLLADTPAGPELAALVASLDLELLDAHDRVEVVAAAGRVASWAHAMKARASAAVDRHWTMSTPITEPIPAGMHVVPERIAAATLALRLQASPRETATLIMEGRCYDGILAETGEALSSGAIDPPRARVIARRLHDQPPLVALQVEAEVLERAEGRTSHQVKQDVERALLQVDAEHAADRHAAARATRGVSRPQVRDDGMAALWVLLPAAEAVQVDGVLEAAARAARAGGDPRTLEQLRADGLCDLVLHRGCTPSDAFYLQAPDRREHAAADHHDAPGTGAADNSEATTSTALTPRPGEVRDGAVPNDVPARTGATAPRTHPRTRVLITIPITTMMGLDDGPAELAGYGPVDAVQARALAWGGTWQRMLTDPRDGSVLDVGRTRYRPPAALAEHVRRRDRTCVWPGCSVPADLADLDHSRDYHRPPDDGGPPGTTSHANLAPLCRNHHRLKTEAGFRLHHVSPGTFVWTDPTGHRYEVRPGTDSAVVPQASIPPPF